MRLRPTRCITPRGGIERIELETEETDSCTKLHLVVDRGSRDRVLDFVESVPLEKSASQQNAADPPVREKSERSRRNGKFVPVRAGR